MTTHLKSEAQSGQGRLEVVSVINQSYRVYDSHGLLKFAREQHLSCVVLALEGRKCGNSFVSSDGGIQPAALVVHLNHCLIGRDVTRHRTAGRL